VIVERPFKAVATNTVVFEVFGAIKERATHYKCKLVIQDSTIPKYIKARYLEIWKRIRGKGDIHGKEAFCHLISYLADDGEDVETLVKTMFADREVKNAGINETDK
jgi:hypothetical protein